MQMMQAYEWHAGPVALLLEWSDSSPVVIRSVRVAGSAAEFRDPLPVVEILAVGHGHVSANDRLVLTQIGASMRYVGHQDSNRGDVSSLDVVSADATTGLRVMTRFSVIGSSPALRVQQTVTNGGTQDIQLQSVTVWASQLGAPPHAQAGTMGVQAWQLVQGANTWLGEGRWSTTALRPTLLPNLSEDLTGIDPRGEHRVVSHGTWSTGAASPLGIAESLSLGLTWLWQVEHNGAWRWEVGVHDGDAYIALSGPTDADHQWVELLKPGQSFCSVPVSVTLAGNLEEAVADITRYRRASHLHPVEDAQPRLVFNDYMNTIGGDPTAERLLPLVSAAAESGVDVFCIDAGWYDDSGNWWDSVGAWKPSVTRFPNGLDEVIDAIHAHGLIPGLWLEPEVVGVRSPLASLLPAEALFQRNGQLVEEQGRYFLDLRHPAARNHLDSVVDRLVQQLGIGYFKFDYNVSPGPGTDVDAHSAGAGLLGHNRAYSEWIDGLYERHPGLILENCGSGAMRMDPAQLARFQVQSTSDQQDYRLYPAIAASAPLSMLPEQAANWAYPQPSMSSEECVFTIVTTLLGRFFLSGYINRMDETQRQLVVDAVTTYRKWVCPGLTGSTPFWPLGLPAWDAPVVALGLSEPEHDLLAVWVRDARTATIGLPLAHLRGRRLEVRQIYPVSGGLPEWPTGWEPEGGVLTMGLPLGSHAARLFVIQNSREQPHA